MIHSPGWTYYERKVYSVNCSSNFECPSGKCINQTSVCDGRDDCGDRSDEIVCQSQLDFQIRLVGSNKTNEGRVEVKGLTFRFLFRFKFLFLLSFDFRQYLANGELSVMTISVQMMPT